VGFGYWSHDIGGHMNGPVEPELYTRWVQFGAFSPVLRTHTTKNPEAERRIWAYPPAYADAMRDAFLLRSALIPYLYTASRRTYDSGVPFLRPLYWDYPESDEAYSVKDEYLFGDELLVAPVVTPRRAETGLATRVVWLPPGTWIEWFSGRSLQGPASVPRSFGLDEIPVYVKAGSIIPMQRPVSRAGDHPAATPLVLSVFPMGHSTAGLYEDQGDSIAYQSGEGAWTTVRSSRDGEARVIRVEPVQGSYPGMPASRAIEVRLRGTLPPARVQVDGHPVAAVTPAERERQRRTGAPASGPQVWYDGETATCVIEIPPVAVTTAVEVRADLGASSETDADGLAGIERRLHELHDLVNAGWPKAQPPALLTELAQTGDRMMLWPSRARAEVESLRAKLPALRAAVESLDLSPGARARAVALLAEIERR
jgi:alpha-glucosidase